ncbi:MAG: hypothetical protein KQJ78_11150 [Deltaproteobacteria bacterium]|nr:hypothetical protein [Deltaproteobacteria bacterium]
MTKPTTITCPHCGEAFDPLATARGEELGELAGILAGFGPDRGLVMDYIGLFRTGAVMRVATQLRLARELKRLWDGGVFEFEGRRYQIARSLMMECLQDVVRSKAGHAGQPAGFSNHNYLKKVMQARASRAEAQQEAKREERRKTGAHRDPGAVREAHERTAQEAADTLAAEARAEGETPIHEQPPEMQVCFLANCYQSDVMRGMELTRLMEERLAHLVDLAKLKALAPSLPRDLAGQGPELLRRCAKGGGQPTAVGECLPGLPG